MRLKENKKMQLLFCVLSVVLIWCVYAGMVRWIKWDIAKEKVIIAKVEEDANVLLDICRVNEHKGKLNISGWVLKNDSDVIDVKVVLKATGDKKEQVLKTTLEESEELEKYIEYLEMGATYRNIGFEASIKNNKLQKDVCYEILLYFGFETEKKGKDGSLENVEIWKKITTGHYLYGNKGYKYNPTKFVGPKFVDEQMNTIVADGEVCAYDSEKQVWLYFHEGTLYWILSKDVNEGSEDTRKMYFHLYSSDVKKLPENCQISGFDNQDFFFAEKQVLFNTDERYRVAKTSLEFGYPITYIRTGLFDTLTGAEEWEFKFQGPTKIN